MMASASRGGGGGAGWEGRMGQLMLHAHTITPSLTQHCSNGLLHNMGRLAGGPLDNPDGNCILQRAAVRWLLGIWDGTDPCSCDVSWSAHGKRTA